MEISASLTEDPTDPAARAMGQFGRTVEQAFLAEIENASQVPLPGSGRTRQRFDYLSRVASIDLAVVRLVEGHLDACAILAETGGCEPRAAVMGVWAAMSREGGLVATPDSRGWRITGLKPYASGATSLTHALVTAQAPDGNRMFMIDTAGLEVVPGTWPALGMRESDSPTVQIDSYIDVDRELGGVDWYMRRPGFWHGSIGVAACWLGGARAVAHPLQRAASPHALAHLGAIDAQLAAAAALLAASASEIDDAPSVGGRVAERRARRVRAVVEHAATETLLRVGRALGAEPLCHDGEHARRVADLTVYLRQSHAESDLERLGQLIARAP